MKEYEIIPACIQQILSFLQSRCESLQNLLKQLLPCFMVISAKKISKFLNIKMRKRIFLARLQLKKQPVALSVNDSTVPLLSVFIIFDPFFSFICFILPHFIHKITGKVSICRLFPLPVCSKGDMEAGCRCGYPKANTIVIIMRRNSISYSCKVLA